MSRVLVVSDLHCPFAHPKTKQHLKYVAKHYKTNRVVCIGDEMDYHGLGRWPVDPDGMSPLDEHKKGVEQLHSILNGFRSIEFLESNHTVRPLKKAFINGIPSLFMRSYREFLEAPNGWTWKSELVIDNVVYIHGEPYTGSIAHQKAALDNQRSTVIGHVHSFGGVQYMKTGRNPKVIFGLNVGCLIDEKAYAFKYGANNRNKPTIGCGVVLDGKQAFFLPLE